MAKMAAICELYDPTPIAFVNVYEDGDRWEKVVGCEACDESRRKLCCGNCPMLTPDGMCFWHLESGRSSKPFHCVVWPTPDQCKRGCNIIYECTEGSIYFKGKRRHLTDTRDVFR